MTGAILGEERDLIGEIRGEHLDLAAAAGGPLQALAGCIEVIANEDVGIGGGINLERVALAEAVQGDVREVPALSPLPT